MTAFRLLPALVAVALLTLLSFASTGCSSSDKTDGDDAGDASSDEWRSEPNENGHTTPHRRWAEGPDGTIMVGNATCCVKGYQVTDRAFAYNGWYIHYCCLGCDIDFEDDTDACVERLLKETGIDVRQPPTEEDRARSADVMAGINGSN